MSLENMGEDWISHGMKNKGKKVWPETIHNRRKAVAKLSLDGELLETYGSAKEAAEGNNLKIRTIQGAAKIGRQSSGFFWKYL